MDNSNKNTILMPKRIVTYNDDCLNTLKIIPNNSVDMVLCDLPYGTTKNKWDCNIPLEPLWEQYERIIKQNGCIALFAQTPFDKVLGASNLKMLKYEWIWQKQQGTGFLNAKKMPLKIHENILIFYNKPPIYNPQMRTGFKPYKCASGKGSSNYGSQVSVVTENDGERYPIDIITYPYDKQKLHPTQKPVALCEYLINTYTNENDLVLDNCMGSGSTGVACVNTNRRFVGIEIEDKYYNIANERILNQIRNNEVKENES